MTVLAARQDSPPAPRLLDSWSCRRIVPRFLATALQAMSLGAHHAPALTSHFTFTFSPEGDP